MKTALPLVVSALLIVVALLIMFTSTGEMRTFGWVLLGIALGATAVNVLLWSRSRR